MERTDYSRTENWIVRGGDRSLPVDVFHLVPTSWIGDPDGGVQYSDINDRAYRAQATFNVAFQASVFDTVCNIYSPHFRQLEPHCCIRFSPEKTYELIGEYPKQDVYGALDYYFEHYNNGKPFILSGHSQGSIILLHILSEYMKNHPEYYKKMVAAYVIGYSVTADYLAKNPHLRFAEKSDDTGVIISYNTESPEPKGESPVLLPGALAINPITWNRGFERADNSLSLGSKIKGRDLEHYADAQIDGQTGRLICSTADEKKLKSVLFPYGIYHIHDYGLYFYDLRKNAKDRISKFFEKN